MYNATNTVIAVAWQSMMGEIIPIKYRNRVFAQRNIWTGLVGMLVAFVAGWGIDRVPYPYGYQAAFTIGFIAALVETWYFMRLHIPSEEPDSAPRQPAESAAHASGASASRESGHGSFALRSAIGKYKLNAGVAYYLFCVSALIYIFAWQAAWPIYTKN